MGGRSPVESVEGGEARDSQIVLFSLSLSYLLCLDLGVKGQFG